ncbi:ribonuclease III domain-containing protein [Herbivorax sp. ANBcel31]|uniref:Mini-ribonuclease 3 n=1 Tax=Herbivorax sp. ANBcel31 TaxID=3069754 RepID=UPI0027B3F374|nr:ribonuclease III domain-containing protein [Herbivorax sp. ANBcel31]MDQ2086434.1 ribonuclease III domain-containing protein [Herbivorax sp. ANBcel31]
MIEKKYNGFLDKFEFKESAINSLSPLALAYIGDSVYEVFVRTFLVSKGNVPVHLLHKKSINYVKAKAQSDILHRIKESLNDEELNIVRRGRNSKSGTIPKNANVTDYKYATGFEALIGYLYLKKNYNRLMHILEIAVLEGK